MAHNYVVSAGTTSSGVTVSKNDTLTVLSGGIAVSTLNQAGIETVSAGGLLQASTVGSSGTENILSGGVASGTQISSGGVVLVSAGGTTSGVVVSGGGIEQLNSGGTAVGTTVLSGGAIDLAYVPFVAGGTANFNAATDVLTISQGGVTTSQTLAGTYTNEYFHLTGGTSGTLVTLNTTPCYCRGTLILTGDGERAVEDLAIGDLVTTPDGPMAIKWIGRRAYSGRFARGNKTVLPIRVAAGAIADGVPCRDLFVSPKHALLLDGVLVPAEVLVNGVTITQASEVERVEYFHIELDRHAILFADGAPAESFVDDHGRGVFHNAHEHAALYPDARPAPAVYCAPRHEDGELIETIRRRLARRADPAGGRRDGGPLRGMRDRAA